MLTKEELPDCPVQTTVQIIGSKWKLLSLRNLLQKVQPQRQPEMVRQLLLMWEIRGKCRQPGRSSARCSVTESWKTAWLT